MGAVLALVLGAALVFVLGGDTAHEVTMDQALQHMDKESDPGATDADLPAPGVYQYRGSGTERLSVPPLSQSEGPVIPGTVTLRGKGCWVLRLDYSSHHWQTYDYCRHGGDTWEAGGQTWFLWSIGPINVTNLATLTCVPGTMSLPASAALGQQWHGSCSGKSTTVTGTVTSAGPYRYAGLATMSVGGHEVRTAKFVRLRTDTGAQHGTERSVLWLDTENGLPVRIVQQLDIRTDTPFGASTFTQSSTLSLVSQVARR